MIACVIASSAAYFVFSRAVRSEAETAPYRRLLWTSFFSQPHGPLIEPMPFDAAGSMAIVVLAIIAIVAGVLTRRAVRSQAPDAGPEVLVYSIAAVVVPALIIATVAWPDGRGWLTNGVLLGGTAVLGAAAAAAGKEASHLERATLSRPRRETALSSLHSQSR